MAEKEKDYYIEDVNMQNAENGVIVSYCERRKRMNSATYDPGFSYDRKQEVFAEENMDDAFARFKELFLEAREYDGIKNY